MNKCQMFFFYLKFDQLTRANCAKTVRVLFRFHSSNPNKKRASRVCPVQYLVPHDMPAKKSSKRKVSGLGKPEQKTLYIFPLLNN